MWCDLFGWLLDCTTDQLPGPHTVPEISLTGLPLAVVLVVGGWMVMEWRRR